MLAIYCYCTELQTSYRNNRKNTVCYHLGTAYQMTMIDHRKWEKTHAGKDITTFQRGGKES